MFPVKCLQLKYFKYLSKWISKFFPFLKVIFQFSAAKVWGCVVEWDIYCMTNSRQNTLTRPTADYLFDFGVTLCYCSKDIFMAAPTLKTNSNFLFKHQLSRECLTYSRWGLCLSLFLKQCRQRHLICWTCIVLMLDWSRWGMEGLWRVPDIL